MSEARELIEDRVIPSLAVDSILGQVDDRTAYLLYLKLAIRFGAGQKLDE